MGDRATLIIRPGTGACFGLHHQWQEQPSWDWDPRTWTCDRCGQTVTAERPRRALEG